MSSVSPFDLALSASPQTLSLLAFSVVLLLVVYIRISSQKNSLAKQYPPPPGPPGLPLVGNLFQVPKNKPWLQFTKWTKEYGPVYRLKLGTQNFIVLGSAKAALDLLDKRSAIYSSRSRQIMTSELVSRNLRMTFMRYSPMWRKQRKLLHQLTSPKAASSYQPIQEGESAWLLKTLLEDPKEHWGHSQRYAGSTIMQIAFRTRALTYSDPAITEMRRVNDAMGQTAVPGRYLVDSLPFLLYIPSILAPFKRKANDIFEDTLTLFKGHYEGVRAKAHSGEAEHCFAKYIIEAQNEYELSDDEASFLAGAMYGAGSETTADAISTFIFTMSSHPNVAKKAHLELDSCIGHDRLPEFDDQHALVYLGAIIREILRWRSVIAGGLAHATVEDDVYEGMLIPKGSTVLPCHWAMHMDPDVYEEPEKFKPERFIGESGQLIGTKYSDRGHHAYGFGRRICSGQHIADRSLFMAFSRLLWAFNFAPSIDPSTGEQFPLGLDTDAFDNGFSFHPKPFKCDITPRGPWVHDIVNVAAETSLLE